MNLLKNNLTIKNSFVSIFFKIVPILIALICIPLNLKHLGPELWGVYNLAVSILFLVMYFNFGIGPSINRLISEYSFKDVIKEGKLVHTGFYINLVLVIIIVGILLLVKNVIIDYSISPSNSERSEISDLFFWTILSSGFYLFISYFRNIYEGKQKFLFVSIIRSIIASFIIASPLFFKSTELDKSGMLLFTLFSLIFLLYFILFVKHYTYPKINNFNLIFFRKTINQGGWMSIHSFI